MSTQSKTAAEAMRERLASRQPDLVEISPEAGFVYTFKKPNTFGIVLSGLLPQAAASEAAEVWAKDGIGEAGEPAPEKTTEEIGRELLALVQKVLEASHSPKLVQGKADAEKNELSVEDVPDAHLNFFLRWMQAGGSEPLMNTFPQQPPKHAVSQPDGAQLRAKTKRNGRRKR